MRLRPSQVLSAMKDGELEQKGAAIGLMNRGREELVELLARHHGMVEAMAEHQTEHQTEQQAQRPKSAKPTAAAGRRSADEPEVEKQSSGGGGSQWVRPAGYVIEAYSVTPADEMDDAAPEPKTVEGNTAVQQQQEEEVDPEALLDFSGLDLSSVPACRLHPLL